MRVQSFRTFGRMIWGRYFLTAGLQSCRCRVSCHVKRHFSFLPDDVKSLRAVVNPDISKIRNIGIMAHIDAGKTTTTERMLYYSGYTRALGDVDDGDTVTDFMAQERERGITIQSAAVTFDWKSHRINLIDTPGHVDFTLEVERALRVLDGAVAVFDASAGVEAQTLTVWRQAEKHHVPCVCFLNKMDKPAANLSFSIESIRQKLKANPVLLQIPVGSGKNFTGVVDLLTNQKLIWKRRSMGDDGRTFESKPLDQSDEPELLQEVNEARAALIEQVADLDDEFAELLLTDFSDSFDAVPSVKLQEAVRRVTLARKGVPVLCGSSLKNKGVQPLLDAIIAYLPAPNERHHDLVRWYKDDLCALAFKVLHDKQRGPLVFLRIYSGTLKPQTAVHNINRNSTERMSRLLVPFADQHVEIPSMTAGNIALTVGLKQTVTGDTIVSSKASAAAAARRAQNDNGMGKKRGEHATVVLSGVEVPDPVFFCTIEPPTMAKQADLDNALNCLQREDPSLKVRVDPDSGQTVLCGMGELHIEIVHDRIRREYGIETHLGPLQVAYRETVLHEASTTDTLDRTVGERRHVVTVELAVRPVDISSTVGSCELAFTEKVGRQLPQEMKDAVENGVHSSYLQDPECQHGTRNISSHGVCLRVPLHA
ncbi:ribosome-releasing factor 2, mitochondrial isoform X2 [Xiphias gladius]|uniref:ribosome-releasing factor 2, mitochondrial isoform X2 n=1 Tax=Xiphias gladius TaxID=8245 RepID=UPI001A984B01|nr:ribosome-releasing factor 2, mitochondrial isoform X2 [Xiphias gladius]